VAIDISITDIAERQLRGLPARTADPGGIHPGQTRRTTDHRIQRLRPNPLAEFELRVGDLRVLYNVTGDEVVLLIVGRKVGNKLIVEGEEFHGHRDNPIEPSGGELSGDAG